MAESQVKKYVIGDEVIYKDNFHDTTYVATIVDVVRREKYNKDPIGVEWTTHYMIEINTLTQVMVEVSGSSILGLYSDNNFVKLHKDRHGKLIDSHRRLKELIIGLYGIDKDPDFDFDFIEKNAKKGEEFEDTADRLKAEYKAYFDSPGIRKIYKQYYRGENDD